MAKKAWHQKRVSHKLSFSILILAIILAAIPLTVLMSQRQQQTQQHAAGINCGYAFSSQKLCETYNGKPCQQIGNTWQYCTSTTVTPGIVTNNVSCTAAGGFCTSATQCCSGLSCGLSYANVTNYHKCYANGTNIGTAITYCSRCSDTYKYCHVAWQSTQSCTDTGNAKYMVDCSCTQGTLDCGLKGINTSVCKQATTTTKPSVVLCSADALKCPNGTYVSRIPPSCNFAPCPSVTTTTKLTQVSCGRCSDTKIGCYATWTESPGGNCSRNPAYYPTTPSYTCPWAGCSTTTTIKH